jgi:hypothetical protein
VENKEKVMITLIYTTVVTIKTGRGFGVLAWAIYLIEIISELILISNLVK